jgi:hypothetical protein
MKTAIEESDTAGFDRAMSDVTREQRTIVAKMERYVAILRAKPDGRGPSVGSTVRDDAVDLKTTWLDQCGDDDLYSKRVGAVVDQLPPAR